MLKVKAPQGAALNTTWTDTPTQTINSGGVTLRLPTARPSHRRAGGLPHPPGRRPGQLGPPSRGRHRCQASGHHLRQPRCRCLQWVHADDHQEMASDAVTFIQALGLDPGRPVRVLHGRHDRPGDRAGGAAARAQDDPRACRPCGERRHRQGDPHHLPRHRAGLLTRQDPKQFLFFTRTPNGRRAGSSSWPGCRNVRTTATRPSPYAHSAPSSRPSTDGVGSPPTSQHPPAVLAINGDSDKMVPTKNTVRPRSTTPEHQLVLYPDAGHGGVFQFHQDFVKRALEFL